jgi:hypothetical protein
VLTGLFNYLTPFRPWHIQHVNFTDRSGHLDSFVCEWIPKEVDRFEGDGGGDVGEGVVRFRSNSLLLMPLYGFCSEL